jgi:hypothetical protein
LPRTRKSMGSSCRGQVTDDSLQMTDARLQMPGYRCQVTAKSLQLTDYSRWLTVAVKGLKQDCAIFRRVH